MNFADKLHLNNLLNNKNIHNSVVKHINSIHLFTKQKSVKGGVDYGKSGINNLVESILTDQISSLSHSYFTTNQKKNLICSLNKQKEDNEYRDDLVNNFSTINKKNDNEYLIRSRYADNKYNPSTARVLRTISMLVSNVSLKEVYININNGLIEEIKIKANSVYSEVDIIIQESDYAKFLKTVEKLDKSNFFDSRLLEQHSLFTQSINKYVLVSLPHNIEEDEHRILEKIYKDIVERIEDVNSNLSQSNYSKLFLQFAKDYSYESYLEN